MLAQDRQAERVEGVDRDVPGLAGKQHVETLGHFPRRPPGEGDRQASGGRRVALGHQMGDPVGQRPRLAGARTGDDQQGPIDRGRGGPLVGIQRRQNAGLRRAVARRYAFFVVRAGFVLRGRRGGGRRCKCALGPWRRLGGRQVEQQPACREPPKLRILEQADDAVLAIVPAVADHLAGAQARDRLRQQRGVGAAYVFHGNGFQDRQLRTQVGDQPLIAACHLLAARSAAVDFRQHLGQRHQAGDGAGRARRCRLGFAAVGEIVDPVLHADRHRLAADRATAAVALGFFGCQTDAAFAVTVHVVLAFLGEEFDGADEAVPGFQRPPDREVVDLRVEGGRLAAQLGRRMGVGVRDQAIAVEERHPPVHRRVGGQPGLDREDVVGEVAVAIGDRVESRPRAQHGEPRRPDMGGNQVGAGPGLQRDLEQVPGIEAEDRPAVGVEVADPPEAGGEAVGGVEIRDVDEVVDLPGQVALLVDRRDLHLEHEPDNIGATSRQHGVNIRLYVRAQPEQSRLGRDELFLQLGTPRRVGEVAGADDRDPLLHGPIGQVLKVGLLARRPRIPGVNV